MSARAWQSRDSVEPLLEVTAGALQVSELFLFSEMVDPSLKNERIPGSGKIEKDILERCLSEMSEKKKVRSWGKRRTDFPSRERAENRCMDAD